ncbi:macrophage mannose receptor 1-like [Anarrhichthys ocellatus]|uniref:macrophage mannose receptor 1-like n=1 Tax=Anarrhichthys ocellatus TaxID=433405 RepID=UPI0012EEB942|nr:macrophage mannose receptor 1-like [Anarrhichthys ocellatus]
MDKLLLSIVVSGLCAVSSPAERRYHFVYDLKNMTEAQRHCRETYSDLATIRDMEDVNTLNTMVHSSQMVDDSSQAWIGLYDDVDSWRWSLSNTSFYKPGETEFRRWWPDIPNNFYGEEYCTYMYTDGYWNDYPCNERFKPVCFDVRGLNETFVLIKNTMTWTEAQSYCREHHTDLASVRNMEEIQKVQKLVTSGQYVWIGLFRDGWKWSDGSDSSFRNWKTRPTGVSKTCAAADFSANGQWEGLNCDVMRAFICYSVPVSMQVIKVRVQNNSSSLDLNDAVVMENLLKKLKQRLKDQGLNDDIKLSWKKQSDGKVFHKEEKKTKKKETCPNKDEL